MSESKKRQERRLHRTKLFGGKETAEELHSRIGLRRPCDICHKAGRIRIRSFVLVDELMEHAPEFAAAIMASNPDGPFIPSFDTKHGKLCKIGDVVACAQCQAGAERAAAHPPRTPGLHPIVEIDRGPGKEVLEVGVHGDLPGTEAARKARARAQMIETAAAVRAGRGDEHGQGEPARNAPATVLLGPDGKPIASAPKPVG